MLEVLRCYQGTYRVKDFPWLLLLFLGGALGRRRFCANLIRLNQVLEAKLHQVEEEVEDVVGSFEAPNKVAVVLFLLIEALSVFELREVDVVVEVSCRDRTFLALRDRLDKEGDHGQEAILTLEE